MELPWGQSPQTQGEAPAPHMPTCSWLELAPCRSHTAAPPPPPHLQHLFPITASFQSIRENIPSPLPLLPNAFVFPRCGCSAPACIHASPTCGTSLEPTASQRDQERESEQQCCRWALPQKQHLCPGPPLPAQLLSAALSANKVTVSWYA